MAARSAPSIRLHDAVEVFVHGFAAVRSRTHPYVPQRDGKLWILRDAPGCGRPPQRRREVVALAVDPAEVARCVAGERRSGKGVRCVVSAIHAGLARDAELEARYRELGFRHLMHEPVFARPLPPVPRAAAPLRTLHVTDAELARRVARAARSGQIAEADLSDDTAARRLYAALDKKGGIIGWVSSIRVGAGSWVSNLYVLPEHRGRGVGGGLMRTMLRDDAKRGIRHSVLTASQAGARLYRKLGYTHIGTLQFFAPARGGSRSSSSIQGVTPRVAEAR